MATRGRWQDQIIRLADPMKRGTILMIVTAVVFSVFAGRLVELQAVRGEALAAEALNQRLKVQTLRPQRGAIVDARGESLALTVEARNLTVDQTLVTDPAAAAAQLAPLIGQDVTALQERLTGKRRFVYVAKGLTPEKWREISALRIPGLFSEEDSRRVYPAGAVAANVVGFLGADGVPLAGLEYSMDATLSGTPGERRYERGPGGRVIPTAVSSRVDPEAGRTVHLSINRDIQHVAQQVIADQVKRTNADSGTVIVMHPKTGDIIAMATAPTFDANAPGDFDADHRGNRALTDIFEPGSTSKVLTLAAVVDRGKGTPYTPITVPTVLNRGGKDFTDPVKQGKTRMTLAGIMAKSSNIGTILAAERIGRKQLHRYLKRFGIGKPLGLGFPGESSGYLPPVENWTATSLPTIAFGQGISMNAIQATSVVATIANDGVRVPPRLVTGYSNPEGDFEPVPLDEGKRAVKAGTAKQVRAMLEAAVREGGTGTNAAIPGYRVGGKTGTAQYVDPRTGTYGRGVMASFIGMAPIDAPELVVGVFLMNPKAGRYGGQVAAPVFQKVLTYALQAERVPPTGTKARKLPLYSGG
jgi:cell division protein FtsI (penicillin-binding protein 3)